MVFLGQRHRLATSEILSTIVVVRSITQRYYFGTVTDVKMVLIIFNLPNLSNGWISFLLNGRVWRKESSLLVSQGEPKRRHLQPSLCPTVQWIWMRFYYGCHHELERASVSKQQGSKKKKISNDCFWICSKFKAYKMSSFKKWHVTLSSHTVNEGSKLHYNIQSIRMNQRTK